MRTVMLNNNSNKKKQRIRRSAIQFHGNCLTHQGNQIDKRSQKRYVALTCLVYSSIRLLAHICKHTKALGVSSHSLCHSYSISMAFEISGFPNMVIVNISTVTSIIIFTSSHQCLLPVQLPVLLSIVC